MAETDELLTSLDLAAPRAHEGDDDAIAPEPPGLSRRAGLIVPALTLAGWELAVRVGALPAHWLPAPSAIVRTLATLASGGVLRDHVLATLGRVAAGFALGVAAATGVGLVIGRTRTARVLFDPSLQALRSIPSLAWVPLFMLWFGIHEGSKIALIAVGVFFPVYLNLTAGLAAIDPKWVEVARIYNYRGLTLARRVLLPATLPFYLAGLRGGLSLGWMFVVAAELMGASRGLGYMMIDGQSTSRPDLIMGALILFAVLGKGTDAVLARLAAHAEPHALGG
ncbi:MAG: ABC transporter permease [Polyangiales bacterium]